MSASAGIRYKPANMCGPRGWLICVALLPAPAFSATLALKIAGVSSQMEASVRGQLTLSQYLSREVTAAQVQRLLNRSDTEIAEALEPFGYYSPTIVHRFDVEGAELHVEFQVTPGEPVRVTELRIDIPADAAKIPAIARVLDAFAPARGMPLDHAAYERSKAAIGDALTSSGYLTSRIREHRVEVSRAARSARVHLSWECGVRYRFGPMRFPPTALSPALLNQMVPWKQGDYYSVDKVLELQKRLNDADYFSATTLQPRLDQVQADEVPIDATLLPARRDISGGGLYASTDTGAGVNVFWQRRWINEAGHKIKIDTDYAERLKSASVSYRVPFAGPRERAFNFGLSYRDEISDSTEERTSKLVLSESRKWRGFTRILDVQLIGGDFEIGSEHGNSNELFAEAVLTRSNSDDPAFPRHGYASTTALRIAPSNVVSRTRFAQLDARLKWIWPSGNGSRILLRAAFGAMTVDDFDQLPPQLRFFAGGDRSIRGFDYEAVGSKNDAGDVIGGRFLAVLSTEYEHYFGGKWGAAAFVDGGDAFLRHDFDWNIGAGIGVRWKSPVGVVRLDVATPVETDLEKSVRVHLTIGPDL
jgi:translocation and assembly module TamA